MRSSAAPYNTRTCDGGDVEKDVAQTSWESSTDGYTAPGSSGALLGDINTNPMQKNEVTEVIYNI